MSSLKVKQDRLHDRNGLCGRRVAVVSMSYYDSDPRVLRATEAMEGAGMEIDVFCLKDPDQGDLPLSRVSHIRIHRFSLNRKRDGRLRYVLEYMAFFFWTFWKVTCAGLLDEKRLDIIHVHNMPDVLVFAVLIPRICGSKVILDLHDPMPELLMTIYGCNENSLGVKILKWLEKRSIHFVDVLLTPNEAFRQLFVERNGCGHKIHIIMNSPSGDVFGQAHNEKTSSLNELRLMYHGLIAKRHGLDILIRAMAALAREGIRVQLDIYGRSNRYLDSVLALASEIGIREHVKYHGFKQLEEIARSLKETDLGIIPNRRTPFTDINLPTRIFECLAIGKPVIVPDTRGIQDYFRQDEILYFVPDSVESLAWVIRWAYRHPVETRGIVARGMEVYQRHLWDNERERFLDIVGGLMEMASSYEHGLDQAIGDRPLEPEVQY